MRCCGNKGWNYSIGGRRVRTKKRVERRRKERDEWGPMSNQAASKQTPISATKPDTPPTSCLSCSLSEECLTTIRTLQSYPGDLQTLEATTWFYGPKIPIHMRFPLQIRKASKTALENGSQEQFGTGFRFWMWSSLAVFIVNGLGVPTTSDRGAPRLNILLLRGALSTCQARMGVLSTGLIGSVRSPLMLP